MNGTAAVIDTGRVEAGGPKGTGFSLGLAAALAPAVHSSPFPSMEEVPLEFRPKVIHQREYLCGGELKPWDGKSFEIRSPLPIRGAAGEVTHPVIGSHPMMDGKAALETLEAARKAYDGGLGTWPMMSAEQRIACTETFLGKMQSVRDEVVNLIMWEIGKTLPDARKEFDRTVEYVRDSIKELRAMDAHAKEVSVTGGIAARIERNPIGVTLCMGPFNYPLNETFTTLMPALLMGNTVVLKAPKIGVLLYQPLLKAFKESFPAGVVNTVYGDGAETVTPIMQDGGVDSLAFIGSGRVADIITRTHKTPHRLHSVLGLGAKNPAVIFPGADLDAAAAECVTGSLSFNGQRCTALKVIFVHSSVADQFVEKFSAKVAALRQGMPWASGAQITPVAEPGKVEYLNGLVSDAAVHGARVVNPGGGEAEGTLYTPAVVYPVSPKARLYTEEQFGPVVPIVRFDDAKEVVQWLKDSPVGQQEALFGRDMDELAGFARQTRNLVSRINFNTQCQRGPDNLPFAARKSSGLATLSIRDALNVFSIETVYAGKDGVSTRDALAEAA